MRTGFTPVVRWLVPGVASVFWIACSPGPTAPLTRDVEVSVAFAWTDAPQQRPANVEIGALPMEKVKPSLSTAIVRRDATVNEAWKEKKKRAAEIEKLKSEIAAVGLASAPPPVRSAGSQIKKEVEACRDTLNSLADTAVLYIEDVKQKLGADFDKERVERFRKNLGAEELRDLALAIKAQDTPQVRKALGDARAILERDVWTGKAAEKEHALRVISEMERVLADAAPVKSPDGGETKAAADLKEHIMAVVKDQMAWDNRLAMANRPILMYTALGDAEVRAKTDGDGKCRLVLPREGRWVIFAYAERPYPPGMSEKEKSLLIAEKEEMCWVIEAPGAGSERATITLSESNAVRPGVAPLKMDSKGE